MKKIYVLFGLLANAIGGVCQTPSYIVVQHGDEVILKTRLDSAIVAAQDGDVIYLPGGLISGSNAFILEKSLVIIGCGYDQDSTTVTGNTILSGHLALGEGASGSILTGFYLNGGIQLYGADSVQMNRIRFAGLVVIPPYAQSDNISINQCIVQGSIMGSGVMSNFQCKNSVIYDVIANFYGEATFENCLFLLQSSGSIGNSNSCYFLNNVILSPPFFISDNLFSHNLFINTQGSLNLGTQDLGGNIFGEPLDGIFENLDGNIWNSDQNFSLKPSCSGVDAGIDGMDMGIYGGANPWKEGGLPSNPHIQLKNIGEATDSNGNLQVQIKVAAQEN
jgi:hypothetical protein